MGRVSSFEDRNIYAAVGRLMSEQGQATVTALRDATGISIGSLYHRFGSREGVMAEAWLYAVRTFHMRIMAAFANDDAMQAGVEAALAIPRFCRDEADIALVLVCCRPSEFLNDQTPKLLREQLAHVNDEVGNAMMDFSRRINRPLLTCRLAIIAFPLGSVRLFLPKATVPKSIDVELEQSVRNLLG